MPRPAALGVLLLIAASLSACGDTAGQGTPITQTAGTLEFTPLALVRADRQVSIRYRIHNRGGQVARAAAASSTDLVAADGRTISRPAREPVEPPDDAAALPPLDRIGPGATAVGVVTVVLEAAEAGTPIAGVRYTRVRDGAPLHWPVSALGTELGTPAAATALPAAGRVAPVGAPIALTGTDAVSLGSSADVPTAIRAMVVRVTDAAAPATPIGTGHRLVGVQLRVQNTGPNRYGGDPATALLLWDDRGQAFGRRTGTPAAAVGTPFPTTPLEPGAVADGLVTVEVPAKTNLTAISLALAGGSNDAIGYWTLP